MVIPTERKRKYNKKVAMLNVISPRSVNQQKIFDSFEDDKHILIIGAAGSGKTFCALYLGLDAVLNRKDLGFKEVVIIRSTVSARPQGFLPGGPEEKDMIYETPYEIICSKLIAQHGVNYKQLKNNGYIKFVSTSYLRGLTFENSIVLMDEIQNYNMGEFNTVLTRAGENCQFLACGDPAQNDLKYLREESCIDIIPHIVKRMPSFKIVDMGKEDIQRDSIVTEWLTAKADFEKSSLKIRTGPMVAKYQSPRVELDNKGEIA